MIAAAAAIVATWFIGPVSIYGQDYVLVESGCVCEPEMSANRSLLNNMELYLPRKS